MLSQKLKATGTAFEYYDGKAWKSVKLNSTVVVEGKTAVTVRTAGVKPNAKNNIEGAFPSNQLSIVAPAFTPTWDSKELVVTASEGNTLTFSVTDGKYKSAVAGTAKYEYRTKADKDKDEAWDVIPSAGLDAGDYQIRVAAVDKVTGPSAAVGITLPKITEAPKDDEE